MSNRADEIRKRISKRQNMCKQSGGRPSLGSSRGYLPSIEEKHGLSPFSGEGVDGTNKSHPLFKQELFMFKLLMALSLFLSIGVLFKNDSPQLEKARNFVEGAFEREFEFATVSALYEDMFGKTVALFPDVSKEKGNETEEKPLQNMYAIPANGRVLEGFEVDGKGIMLETGVDATVDAVKGGKVVFAGTKKGLGKTVEVQHADGTYTLYGNLADIQVKLYDEIDSKTPLGKVTMAPDGMAGTFYFSIRKGDQYIDPASVLRFN